MRSSSVFKGLRITDPPWVHCHVAPTDSYSVPKITLRLTNLLQTKLRRLSQQVRSPEFSRQVLLSIYRTSIKRHRYYLPAPFDSQLYDGYRVPSAYKAVSHHIAELSHLEGSHRISAFSTFVAQSETYTLAELLMLHLFSFVIDEVANYWKQVVSAREAHQFSLVLIALRDQLKCGFLVRSLHTPLRFSRQSIHPIATVA